MPCNRKNLHSPGRRKLAGSLDGIDRAGSLLIVGSVPEDAVDKICSSHIVSARKPAPRKRPGRKLSACAVGKEPIAGTAPTHDQHVRRIKSESLSGLGGRFTGVRNRTGRRRHRIAANIDGAARRIKRQEEKMIHPVVIDRIRISCAA